VKDEQLVERRTVQMAIMEADGETLNRLAENERHFQTIQAGVRGLASTWTLAAFASIAILLKQAKDVTWLFSPLALVIIVIIICLMANIGLSILWIIDQLVYQRLFNTNYLGGLRLEQQFSFIPPVRAIQALTTRRRSIASWVKLFYIGPILAFAVTALVAIVISISSAIRANMTIDLLDYAMAVVALLSLALFVWVIYLYHAHKVSVFDFAASLPDDYSTILKQENCLSIIGRHVQRLNAVNANVEKTEEKRHG
jgi:hypothetical protein